MRSSLGIRSSLPSVFSLHSLSRSCPWKKSLPVLPVTTRGDGERHWYITGMPLARHWNRRGDLLDYPWGDPRRSSLNKSLKNKEQILADAAAVRSLPRSLAGNAVIVRLSRPWEPEDPGQPGLPGQTGHMGHARSGGADCPRSSGKKPIALATLFSAGRAGLLLVPVSAPGMVVSLVRALPELLRPVHIY